MQTAFVKKNLQIKHLSNATIDKMTSLCYWLLSINENEIKIKSCHMSE